MHIVPAVSGQSSPMVRLTDHDRRGATWLAGFASACRSTAADCETGGLTRAAGCWRHSADMIDGYADRRAAGYGVPRCEWERSFDRAFAQPSRDAALLVPGLRAAEALAEVAFTVRMLVLDHAGDSESLVEVVPSVAWLEGLEELTGEMVEKALLSRVLEVPEVLAGYLREAAGALREA